MNSFASWGLTVLGLAIVISIAEMLLPQGKMRKVIRSVFATVTALVIVTPLPSLLKIDFDPDWGMGEVKVDSDYLEYTNGVKAMLVSAAVNDLIKEKGYKGVDVEVKLDDAWNVHSAVVKFSNSGMTENGEHINKSEIIGLIADYLRIGEEAIMTYG